ncbi:Uncharacterized protein Fot_24657 [Forsythia ovata]|uniref:Uncharacterized protein n=1 Tax=Forsythia ovata TaxID=205694 RepID=A0ABD1U6W5_9LAMI
MGGQGFESLGTRKKSSLEPNLQWTVRKLTAHGIAPGRKACRGKSVVVTKKCAFFVTTTDFPLQAFRPGAIPYGIPNLSILRIPFKLPFQYVDNFPRVTVTNFGSLLGVIFETKRAQVIER